MDTRQAKQTTRGNLFDAIILYIHKKRTAIPLRNLVFFTRQLATMFSAGLTIEKSLNNLLYEEGNRKFKKVIAELLNDVKRDDKVRLFGIRLSHLSDNMNEQKLLSSYIV